MIEMIWAQDSEGGIGFEGKLLFNIPEDMAIFKTVTDKKPLIMGRKTFDTLPRKPGQSPLPGRYKYVLSRLAITESPYPDVEYISFDDCLKMTERVNKDFVVIGGGDIYRLFLPYAKVLHITGVLARAKQVDVYAPEFEKQNWEKLYSGMMKSIKNYTFEYAVWRKKQKYLETL